MRRPNLPQVDPASPLPRYVQARTILAEAIGRGQFPRGTRLPGTGTIARCLHVSLVTAHKAIQCLVSEGWLERGRGRGTLVRDDYEDRIAAVACYRVGLLLEPGVRVDDLACSMLLQGLREAAANDDAPVELFIQREGGRTALVGRRANGFICLCPSRETLNMLEGLGDDVPAVVLGGVFRDTQVYGVDTDDEQAARDAVRHLAELGHRRIAILTGPLARADNLHRYKGYLAEMHERGLPLREPYMLTSEADGSAWSIRRRLVELLREGSRPTAILAGNHDLALEVLAVARRLGLGVPQELSLVGFDDPRTASLLDPPLTTLRQPLDEMARLTMRRMLALLAHTPPSPRMELLPAELAVRESTGPAPTECGDDWDPGLNAYPACRTAEPVA